MSEMMPEPMTIDRNIFRAYDIRGKADMQITPEACRLIGRGFGTTLRTMYKKEHPTVAVGRDARTHGPKLEAALIEGLVSTGCHVLGIGQTPSPVNYFTIWKKKLDGGVQVTASHNPAEDNGLKLQVREAEAYAGHDLQKLRALIESGKFMKGSGRTEDIDAETPYAEHLATMFSNAAKGLRIAVDAGNGVAGPLFCRMLKEAGAEVSELYTKPDGTFPNHAADPSKWETLKELQATVAKKKLDCGLAFDGDGDRLGLVDERGAICSADDILLLLAEDHLARHAGAPIVFTVSNSGVLETEIAKWGGTPIMCKVGHSFVEHAMRECGAKLGGEQSGHFFCFENYGSFDDALVATLRVLAIMTKGGKPLSALLNGYPNVFQAPERRPGCLDAKKRDVIRRVTAYFEKLFPVVTLDGVRIDFGQGAWAGIRQSNTSPRLSICIEARSGEKLKDVETIVLDHMKTYPEIIWE